MSEVENVNYMSKEMHESLKHPEAVYTELDMTGKKLVVVKDIKDTEGNDPMVGIVWYNGLEDTVIKWKDHKAGYDEVPYYKYKSSVSEADYAQLEMVWMYLVLRFGNYGTSPRSGWIEDSEGYKKWFEGLEELTKPVG